MKFVQVIRFPVKSIILHKIFHKKLHNANLAEEESLFSGFPHFCFSSGSFCILGMTLCSRLSFPSVSGFSEVYFFLEIEIRIPETLPKKLQRRIFLKSREACQIFRMDFCAEIIIFAEGSMIDV